MPQASLFHEYDLNGQRLDPPEVGTVIALPFGEQTGDAKMEKEMFIGTTRLTAIATKTIASITAFEGWASAAAAAENVMPSKASDRWSVLFVVTAHRAFGMRWYCAKRDGADLGAWDSGDTFDSETGLGSFVPPDDKNTPIMRSWARECLREFGDFFLMKKPGWAN